MPHLKLARCLLFLMPAFMAGCGSSYSGFNPQPAEPDAQACKFLKAADYAYQVHSAGTIADPAVATIFSEEGEAHGFVNGNNPPDRDAAYLWLSKSELVVVFRGTLPFKDPGAAPPGAPVAQDWLNDADFQVVVDPQLGQVHKGFHDSLDNLWGGIDDQIKQWKHQGKITPGLDVYLAGHSKGGPLAEMAAVRLAAEGMPVTGVYTYAGARAGKRDFVDKYQAARLDKKTWRYENEFDVVPHLPMTDAELHTSLAAQTQATLALKPQLLQAPPYAGTGMGPLRYIFSSSDDDSNLNIIAVDVPDEEATLDTVRLDNFGKKILTVNHGNIAGTVYDAHGLDPAAKSRYYLGVCGAPPQG